MRTALIAGASGLVGSALVSALLDHPSYDRVNILVRKPLPLSHPKLFQTVVDFEQPDTFPKIDVTDAYCSLGTTIAKAGSQAAFVQVDMTFVLNFAKAATGMGARGFYLVSSMGANPASSIFYNKVKGEVEEALKAMPFQVVGIFRPSLLLGPRKEKRFGERMATIVMKGLNFMIPDKYKAIHVDKVARAMIGFALEDAEGIHVIESGEMQ